MITSTIKNILKRFEIATIKNSLIIFGSLSGVQILWLIFWINVVAIVLEIFKATIFLIYPQPHLTEFMKTNIIMTISIPLYIIIIKISIPAFILWKGIKLRSKKILRWFVILKSVLLPINIISKIIIDTCTSWTDKFGTDFGKATEYALNVFFVALSIYGIYVVYVCYNKLDSPIMTHLHNHCHQLREIKSAELSYQDYSPKIDVADFETSNEKPVSVDPYRLEKFILNPLDVTIDSETFLGEGQFGKVYQGTFTLQKDKIKIAAKVAKNIQSLETIEMILQEIKVFIHVGDHENIIKFYGVTSDASVANHLALITEYLHFGSLEDFLKEKRHTFKDFTRESGVGVHCDKPPVYINLNEFGTHSTVDLIRLSADIARGMEHLALKKVVHGDLACRNVLLTQDLRAKLTDFGMSRRLYTYQMYSTMHQQKCHLPWRWMSIEAIEDLNLSEKSDVWSYGVTLWEMFTLSDFPFKGIEWSLEIPKQLRQGLLKLSRPRYANTKIFNIMTECWSIDLNKRPTFRNLAKELEDILEEIKVGR